MKKISKLEEAIQKGTIPPNIAKWVKFQNIVIVMMAIEKEKGLEDITKLDEKEVEAILKEKLQDKNFVEKAWEDYFGVGYLENGKFSQFVIEYYQKDSQNPKFQKLFLIK